MQLKLQSGREIKAGINHNGPNHIAEKKWLLHIEYLKTELRQAEQELDKCRRATTKAWVREGEADPIETMSDCSAQDNFIKRVGRESAVARLMDALRASGYSREERREVSQILLRGPNRPAKQTQEAGATNEGAV